MLALTLERIAEDAASVDGARHALTEPATLVHRNWRRGFVCGVVIPDVHAFMHWTENYILQFQSLPLLEFQCSPRCHGHCNASFAGAGVLQARWPSASLRAKGIEPHCVSTDEVESEGVGNIHNW